MEQYAYLKNICENICKNIYSYTTRILNYIGISLLLFVIEFALIIMLPLINLQGVAVNATILGLFGSLRSTGFHVSSSGIKELISHTIKSRFSLGILLYLGGYVSMFSAFLIGLTGFITSIWLAILALCVQYGTSNNNFNIHDIIQDTVPLIFSNILRTQRPIVPTPQALQWISEPVINAQVEEGTIEGIDLTPFTNGELVWAINRDIRHLIRDANAATISISQNPQNPFTREPITVLARARITVVPIISLD